MIAPLRRRHRLMTMALAIAVPVLYVVALAARPDEPVTPQLPAALAPAPAGEVDNDFGELFSDPPIVVRSRTDGSRQRRAGVPPKWWLELEPRAPLARPEVLVYWSKSPATDRLPEDAWLIGGLAGDRVRAFELPLEAMGLAGYLVLYSLGHQEVVASAELPAFGQAAQESGAETPADATGDPSPPADAPAEEASTATPEVEP